MSTFFESLNGIMAFEKISYMTTPSDHTSVAVVNLPEGKHHHRQLAQAHGTQRKAICGSHHS